MADGKILNTEKSGNSNPLVNTNIFYGKVVSIDDPLNEGRIKVSIPSFDRSSKIFCKDLTPNSLNSNDVVLVRKQGSTGVNGDPNSITNITDPLKVNALSKRKSTNNPEVTNQACTEVPWAVSLLPKHLQVMPKVGEMCMVIVFNNNNPQQNRAWIGPLMSDKSKLSYEDANSGGDLLNSNVIPKSTKDVTENLNENGEDLKRKGDFTGGFPEKTDIAIMGRNNSDIVLPTRKEGPDRLNTGGEVLIRAGKFSFKKSKELTLNTVNPGFLRIKVMDLKNDIESSETHSMLYSDYISIVSYKNSDGRTGTPKVFKINPLLEKDVDLKNFHDALSPMVRGDRLVEFLRLLVNYVKNHNHPYHKHPATNSNSKPEIEKFDLLSILSPHIRIN
jgi:hypothetical protein